MIVQGIIQTIRTNRIQKPWIYDQCTKNYVFIYQQKYSEYVFFKVPLEIAAKPIWCLGTAITEDVKDFKGEKIIKPYSKTQKWLK